MHTLVKRRAALLLALICLLPAALGGCGATGREAASPAPGAGTAKGRYVEREIPLPPGTTSILSLQLLEGGTLELLAELGSGSFGLYTSADGGGTWIQSEAPWLQKAQGGEIDAFAHDPQGGIALAYSTAEQLAADEAAPTGEISPDGGQYLLRTDGQGAVISERRSNGEDGWYFFDITVTEAGDYISSSDFYNVYIIDPESLEVKNTISAASPISGYQVVGDTLAVACGSQIVLYDLATGDEKQTLQVDAGFYESDSPIFSTQNLMRGALNLGPDGAFYFCDKSGIYRQQMDGALLEQIVDGTLTSLSMPAYYCYGLTALGDGSFLIRYRTDSGFVLMRYTFDDQMPAKPDTELTVYALNDTKTVRQAIGEFQRANTNVRVSLQTALGQEGATASDVIRALNTELLAGKGPDVLVLDSLPLAGYEEKGVLRDLSPLVNEKISGGEWLGKAGALSRGGKVYALPARFGAPLLLLPGSEVPAGVEGIAGLAEWVEKERAQNGGRVELGLVPRHPKKLLREFYTVCSPAWLKADGTLDEAALGVYLLAVKKMADATMTETDRNPDGDYLKYLNIMRTLDIDSAAWCYDVFAACPATVEEISHLAVPLSAIEDKGEGVLLPLPGLAENVFVPQCLLGVNDNGPQQELAQKFVEAALSESVQHTSLGDGLPINAAAFKALAQEAGGPGNFGNKYGFDTQKEGFVIYEAHWPAQERVAAALQMVEALDTPSPSDEETLQLLLSETEAYFAGEASLEQAVDAVAQKLKLRSAE